MKKYTTTLALCFFSAICGFSQVEKKSVVIGELISKPNAILILNPADDNQGFLLPQVTTTNRLAIVPSSPAEDGLMLFDITEKLFYHWKNGQWVNGLGSGVNQTLIYDPTNNTISLSDGNTISLTGVPAGIAGGDLTGDYPNPGVANNAITSAKILDNGITSADILDATITPLDLANNAVTTTKISDGAVTNVKLANTTVTPGSYGTGTQVSQFVVDAQGRITSANNVALTGVAPTGVAGGDLTGTYPNPDVAISAITSAKILDGTIIGADILDLTIASTDLANNAVTTLKITDGAVTNTKLANTTVTPNTYGTAVTVPQFTVDAQGRITSANNVPITGIAPTGAAGGDLTGTYPNPNVGNNAITSAKILDGTISSADILDATITPLDLANNAVTTTKITDGAVTNLKLANTTVTPGSYGNGTQVSQLVVDAQGRITSASNISITGAAPTGAAGGDLTGTYPNPTVGSNAITGAKILDGTITPLDLASNAVTTTKILDGAVTNLKLANTPVTPGSYGTGTQVSQFVVDAQGRITSASNISISGVAPTGAAGGDLTGTYPNPNVGNNAITSAKILDGTISSADILDATITPLDLANNAVTTTKILDGAVTNLKLANTTVTPGSYGNGTQVSQLVVDAQGRITSASNIAITGAAPTGAAGGDLTGTYPNPTVGNNAITGAKILDGTISSADILDATIATADLANNAVTTLKILDGAVTNLKLANTTVTPGSYGNGTQVSQLVVDAQGRITSASNVAITGAAPTGAAGGDLSGTYPNPIVGSNAITSAKILDGTIVSADIQDATISNADLANNAVTTLKIIDGAVTNLKLANTTVIPGTYGTATEVSQITVDAQGRITSAVNIAVPGLTPQTSYYSVDPSDFAIVKDGGQVDKHNIVIFDNDNTFVSVAKQSQGDQIMAALHLPHGAIIDQVIFYYWDSETTAMNFRFLRKNLSSTSNDAPLINFNTTGSFTSIRNQTFPLSETVSNELYTYRILIDLNINSDSSDPSDVEQRVYGVRIRYQH